MAPSKKTDEFRGGGVERKEAKRKQEKQRGEIVKNRCVLVHMKAIID